MHAFTQSTQSIIQRSARVACVAGLTAALAFGGALATPSAAYAASAETLSELSRLQGQVQSAADAYNQASARADELNEQASQIAEQILEIEQEQLPEQQQKASDAARDLYKQQSSASSVITMLLTANSLEDFFAMSKYLTTIQDDQVATLNDLNELEDELNAKLADMSKAKDDAVAAQEEASQALAQAQSAAAEMQQKANSEDAAEAEAARQAAEQAAALAAQEEAKQQASAAASTDTGTSTSGGSGTSASTAGSGNQSQGGSAPSQSQPSQSQQTQQQPSSSGGSSQGSGSQGSATTNGGWKSGKASYYGLGDGLMGATTASGATVTETSMGVAMLNVPLGTRVEISYNGKSVVAVVNDRGPYSGGRVIDMQPAVARALGFISVGVGTVQYRFL